MNILQVQDDLKNFSEEQLVDEMQMPSGNAPQFLVLSELNRRKRMKTSYDASMAQNEPTVAEDAVASAGVPQTGIAGMAKAMAPKSESSLVAPMQQNVSMQQNAPMQQAIPMQSGGDLSTEIRRTINYLNASSDKSKSELEDIKNKLTLDESNPFESFQKQMDARGKEISDFSKMGQQDFSKMSMQELLEMQNRMRDLGVGKKEGGVIKAQDGLPLGVRNFNLGNIRPGAGFIGEKGVNKGYATFENPMFGGRALARLLNTYNTKYGINTIEDLVNRYAPEGDNPRESIENYKKFLSKSTGLGVDEEFDLDSDRGKLMQGIFQFETGQDSPFSKEQINQMIEASKLDDEDKVRAMLASGNLTSDFTFPDSQNYGARDKSEKSFKDFINELPKNFLEQKIMEPSYEDRILRQMRDVEDQQVLPDEYKGFYEEDKKDTIKKDKPYSEYDYPPPLFPETYEEKEDKKQIDKTFQDLEGGVAQGISEIDDMPPKTPVAKDDTSKALTLDEQLVAMQDELRKGREQDKWLAIAQAGLSIMSSDKPTLAGALGEGAGVGLQAYRDSQKRYQEGVVDLLNARAKLKGKTDTFGTKDILTRLTAVDNSIAKERDALAKMLNPESEDAEKIRRKIITLTNLRDNLSMLAGFKPFTTTSDSRKATIAGA